MSALNTIDLMLNDLQDAAAEWDRLGDEERTAWSIDWSNEMSALERLGQQAAFLPVDPSFSCPLVVGGADAIEALSKDRVQQERPLGAGTGRRA